MTFSALHVKLVEQGIDWPAWISACAAVVTLLVVAITAGFALVGLWDARRTRHAQLYGRELMRGHRLVSRREADYDRRTLPARLSVIATLVLTALTVTALTACGGADGQRSAATSASTARDGSPAPTVVGETGQQPHGGPAPPELQGTWLTKYLGTPARLYIRANGFAVSLGVAGSGQIVVRGDEIDFFGSAHCGLSLPEGVGRYRWKISGDRLRLHAIGKDACGGRASILTHGAFKRVG